MKFHQFDIIKIYLLALQANTHPAFSLAPFSVLIELSLVICFFSLLFFLGSGPDRGLSLVEWGDLLSIHLSVCPPLLWLAQDLASQASGTASQASGPARQASGPTSQV